MKISPQRGHEDGGGLHSKNDEKNGKMMLMSFLRHITLGTSTFNHLLQYTLAPIHS